jgi:hypothetical protein
MRLLLMTYFEDEILAYKASYPVAWALLPLKGLSSEISAAKSVINQYVSVTGCGAEIFS